MEQVPFSTERTLSEYLYRQLNQLEQTNNSLRSDVERLLGNFGNPDKVRYLGEGNKNYLINGNCAINQRTTGSPTVAAGTGLWILDRWYLYNGTNATLTFTHDSIAYGGSSAYKAIKLSWAAGAPTTGDVTITTKIEDAKTLSGQIATLQYAMKSGDVTATVEPKIYQDLTGGVTTTLKSLGIKTAISDMRVYSHTFEADDVSALATTANAGFVQLDFHIGWRSATYPFYITNFQLESGDKATAFEYEQREATFRKCCRYFQSIPASGFRCNGQYYNTTDARFFLCYLYHMRNTPALAISARTGDAIGFGAVTFATGPTTTYIGVDDCSFDLIGSAAMAAYQSVALTSTITLDAEL